MLRGQRLNNDPATACGTEALLGLATMDGGTGANLACRMGRRLLGKEVEELSRRTPGRPRRSGW